jgi:hypothetical protein
MGQPPAPPHANGRQSRAVLVLAVTLAALVTLWAVGTYLLLVHTPDLGELPGSTISPSPSATE